MAISPELVDKIKKFRELLRSNAPAIYEAYKEKKTKKMIYLKINIVLLILSIAISWYYLFQIIGLL